MFERWNDFERTFAAVDQMRRRMEQVFGNYEDEPEAFYEGSAVGPAMALADEGQNLVLRAELPGLADKDITVSLSNDVLTVQGERRLQNPEGHSVHRQERRAYRFARSFTLPARIESEKITASMKDGVLQVTLPKVPESQPRQITVKTS